MDKIEKFLRQLIKKEQEMFLLLLEQLHKDYTKVPGIKLLTGYKNVWRVRVGRYRIIFKVGKTGVEILKITKRDEQTYRNL